MSLRRATLWAAAVGLGAAAVVIAVTEVVALLVAPASSSVLAVGSLVIDLAPPWLKDLTIALFGEADKIVLLVMVGLLVAVLAVVAGVLEHRRRPWGAVLLGLLGVVALVAVLTRAEATPLWAVPTLLGVVAGIVVLRLLMGRLARWSSARGTSTAAVRSAGVARRSFLTGLAATAAGAVVVGIAARAANAASSVAETVREALRLPAATTRAAAPPLGAELDVPGITPLVTPNRDFYRIDTALQVPRIDAAQWTLRVTGLVEQEVEIGWDELAALPLQESYVTLMCVSNEVGGDLTGNALWLGYPIRDILARARPLPEADMVLSRSQDGWTAGTPLDVLQDPGRDALLAIGMNGELLPLEHGFPARLVVPGLYGYVSATKWVVELKVTRFDRDIGYWTPRGWSALGPVKTHSRIDVPRDRTRLAAGTTAIAGIAWAQHTGIERVEVRIDGGAWQQARLAEAISVDTWRQWVLEWPAEPGTHVIEVRATDLAGRTQTEPYVPVAPDGAEGYHGIVVQVDA
ncbi:molybdopterin-dependent oxidoreductase [Microcella sp.]|uniref:molybdopterin-dependent oxidoreductase n=1 Tax=Microcella sp. TaxID=1913979 RepID=UPI003918A51C